MTEANADGEDLTVDEIKSLIENHLMEASRLSGLLDLSEPPGDSGNVFDDIQAPIPLEDLEDASNAPRVLKARNSIKAAKTELGAAAFVRLAIDEVAGVIGVDL